MQLAYLYSRYPVVSQTFCDMEMLELERRGYDLLIGSVHPAADQPAPRAFRPISVPCFLCAARCLFCGCGKRKQAMRDVGQRL